MSTSTCREARNKSEVGRAGFLFPDGGVNRRCLIEQIVEIANNLLLLVVETRDRWRFAAGVGEVWA
jgi:hypothetical protein